MPKMKTKSSAKKRFSFTASGLVKFAKAGRRHNLRKRNKKMLRDSRGTAILHPSEAKRICDHCFHI